MALTERAGMPERLDSYLAAWGLSDPKPLAQTVTSHVYTVSYKGTTAVLKLLTDAGWEERTGARALDYYGGHGAVRIFRYDDHAQLLEYVDGEDLIPLVKRGEDERATEIIANVLNKLHQSQPGVHLPALTPLRKWFRQLFARADRDRQQGVESIFVRAATVAGKLLSESEPPHVLHGDIHHENIRYSARRGWLAFDPKGLLGERAFDAANTLYNPVAMPALIEDEARLLRNAGILSRALGIDFNRLLSFAFVYGCLSAVWWLDDGKEPGSELRIAGIIERHIEYPLRH
nr:MAG: hypothetical protein DIU68_19345 [Chloroflexota bacterium]